VVAGNSAAAIEAAKLAVGSLRQQLAEAQQTSAAMVPGPQKDALDEACARVNAVLTELLTATKAALANPNDAVAREKLMAAIEAARAISTELAVLTNPPDNSLFEDLLARATQRVIDALDQLDRASRSGDPQQLANAINQVTQALTKQAAIARSVAQLTDSPAQKNRIMKLLNTNLRECLAAVVGAAQALNANPTDKVAAARLGHAIGDGKQLVRLISDACGDRSEQVLNSVDRLRKALDALCAAQTDDQKKAAQDNAKEIGDYQMALCADRAKRHPRNGGKRLLELVQQLSNSLNALEGQLTPTQEIIEHSTQLADAYINTPPTEHTTIDQLLTNTVRLDQMIDLTKKAAIDLHDREGAYANATVLKDKGEQEKLLALLASKKKRLPGSRRDRLVDLAAQLSSELDNLLPAVDKAIDTSNRDTTPLKQRLDALSNKANQVVYQSVDLPLEQLDWTHYRLIRDAKYSQPINVRSREALLTVLEQLSKEQMLALLTCKQSSSGASSSSDAASTMVSGGHAERKILSVIEELDEIKEKIEKCASAAIKAPQDHAKQAAVHAALRECAPVSERLVDLCYAAGQENTGKALLARLENNGIALEKDLREFELLSKQPESVKEASKLLSVLEERFKSQQALANRCGALSKNPQARSDLNKVVDQAKALSAKNTCRGALSNPQLLPSSDQQLEMTRKVNTALIAQSKKAIAAPPPVAKQVSIKCLSTAAQHVEIATANLNFDDTPKGRLNRAARNIALEMRKLATAAAKNDKKGMIQSAMKISQEVRTLVKDARAVGTVCRDNRITQQLVSMAQAGQNWSVQLKILCAVKSATSSTDETTESQLLTCATGLAKSVVNTVQEADVAELKHK